MSNHVIIDYNQGVDPICALLSVTFAVYKACEQYDILLDFEVLQRELEHWALKKYRDEGENVDPNMSDSDNDENTLGIGRGFRPQDFNDALMRKMKNKKNDHLCFFRVMVDKIGDQANNTSKEKYCSKNKHVIIEFRQMIDHCMYVVKMVDNGGNYFFLCQDSASVKSNEDDFPIVQGQQEHELFRISVRIKRSIAPMERMQKCHKFYSKAISQM